jgi:class 3 adenylate cyclase
MTQDLHAETPIVSALVPQIVVRSYANHQFDGTFEAVTLFIDLTNFTRLTETLMHHKKAGAEALTDVLNALFGPLVQAVHAHGGFITTFGGDAFTAIFPVETTAYAAALRAINAGITMQQRFFQHPQVQTPFGTFAIGARVGIGIGTIVWNILCCPADECQPNANTDACCAYLFQGPAIDACAEAEHRAKEGDIILPAEVVTLFPKQATVTDWIGTHHRLQMLYASIPADMIAPPTPAAQSAWAPFVPRDVATFLNSNARAEFRYVAVAFLSLNQNISPPELQQFVTTTMSLVQRYGGYFNKLDSGDKGTTILILFGAPVAHANDPERAASFLLDLRTQMPAIPWRAGLTFGIVYAGIIGSEVRCEYTAIGDVVNMAARLMMKAAWGEAWSTAAMAKRLRNSGYHLEQRGTFTFKGKQKPITVERLIQGPGRVVARAIAAEPRSLVGREAEYQTLLGGVSPLRHGSFVGISVVAGEAGIGKSRLVYELQQGIERTWDVAPAWFYGPCDAMGGRALAPFRTMLASYFNQAPEHTPRQNSMQFRATLQRLIATLETANGKEVARIRAIQADLERASSFLGALLDLHWPQSPYEQLAKEPELRFENTLYALRTFIQAVCLCKPVVLQIEDIHWLDPDSHKLVTLLSRSMQGYPLAIVCTSRYRSDGSHVPLELDPQTPLHTLDLAPLSEVAVVELVSQVAGQTVMEELALFLKEKAGGNPFFIEQLLLHLHEQGHIITLDDGAWDIATQEDIEVPLTVTATLVARFDRLDGALKQVIQAAAVLGNEFSVRVLAHMLADDVPNIAPLVATGEGLVWTRDSDQTTHYHFNHALLRDAAYEMQLRTRLRDLHARAGSAIEQVYASDLAPQYLKLAYHFNRAEDPQREGTYARLSGTYAAEAFENDNALRYLSRALELIAPDAYHDQYDLLLVRARVYDRLGMREQQSSDMADLSTLASKMRDPVRQASVALQQARYGGLTGQYPIARMAAKRVVELGRRNNEMALTAQGYLAWGNLLWL